MNGANLRISLNSGNNLRLNLSEPATEQIRVINPASNIFSGKISINTTEGWIAKRNYIPKLGEIAIFSDRHVVDGVNYPGIKIGDGLAYVVDLPFFGDDETARIIDILNDHIENTEVHITNEERSFWNAKLNCEIDDENLILTRN